MSSSADEVKTMQPTGRRLDIQEAHSRHATLVDKKFVSGLSETEQRELRRLEVYLNEVDAELYEPIKKRLQAALRTSTKA